MKFGLYLPNEGPFADVRTLAALAREAEAVGWDGVFIWDAFVPICEHCDPVRAAVGESGDMADAFVALTAIAAHTSRIAFGAMVTPVARWRPESFARATATLHRFSGGRLVVGAGLGSPDVQFSAFGLPTDARTRAAMTDEFLDVLSRLWTGEKVTFRGEHYTVDDVALRPAAGRIPVWIGAESGRRAPRRRAARWDGFIPASGGWPDEVVSPAEFKEIARDVGPGCELVLIGSASGALDDVDDYAAAGVTWMLAQALTVDAARERIRLMPPRAGTASTA